MGLEDPGCQERAAWLRTGIVIVIVMVVIIAIIIVIVIIIRGNCHSVWVVVEVLPAIVGEFEPGLSLGNFVETVVSLGILSKLLADRLRPGCSGLGKCENDDVTRPQSVGLGDLLGFGRDVGHYGVAAGSPSVPFFCHIHGFGLTFIVIVIVTVTVIIIVNAVPHC